MCVGASYTLGKDRARNPTGFVSNGGPLGTLDITYSLLNGLCQQQENLVLVLCWYSSLSDLSSLAFGLLRLVYIFSFPHSPFPFPFPTFCTR